MRTRFLCQMPNLLFFTSYPAMAIKINICLTTLQNFEASSRKKQMLDSLSQRMLECFAARNNCREAGEPSVMS